MAGLADLAGGVRSSRTSARDLVRESLRRIEALDGPINAVVARCDEVALAAAADVDARVARGQDPGPLAGLPMLVKDLEDVAGMVTTKGSLTLADSAPAVTDGMAPQRLKAAGAIVVGKTNLPEFASEGFTSNLLFGATANPWALAWSPGGSSGGAGAALAAGLAAIATGTDGGGSIRIPAAFCGLVGLKPTRGLVGRRPIPDWLDLSTDGPLATSVADLRLLLEILAFPAAGDPESFRLARPLAPARPTHLVAAERTHNFGPLPSEVVERFHEAVGAYAELVALPVQWLSPDELFPAALTAAFGMAPNPDWDWFLIAAAEHVGSLGRDWVRTNLDRLHPATAEFLGLGLDVDIDAYLAARRRRFDYAARLDEVIGEFGVLLTPTVAVSGLPADGRLDDTGRLGATDADVYSTATQNLTGHPAISVPAGRCDNGVPFGLQLTTARGTDWWLLDLAARWEAAHPWPLVAPGYEVFAG